MQTSLDVEAVAGLDRDVVPTIARRVAAKRVVDVVLATLMLVVLVPMFVLVTFAIKLDSRGPVLYRCRRVGFRGRELRMLKFRKMRADAGGPGLTAANDTRLTRCGRMLAATKLDELPQLWHVLTGEMSLVGPRPEDPAFVAVHQPEYAQILEVKPGITGLSQLAFARETSILDPEDRINSYLRSVLPAKVRLDLLYAQSGTIGMDLRILAWTAVAILLRRDVAVNRDNGQLGRRRRLTLGNAGAERGEG